MQARNSHRGQRFYANMRVFNYRRAPGAPGHLRKTAAPGPREFVGRIRAQL